MCPEGLSDQLRNLFDYLNDMTVAEDDPGIAALDDAVQMCNNGEARLEIMLWEHELQNKWARGREEGFAEGLAEGEAKGKAEGLAEGKAEGFAEATKSVAKKLFLKGMSREEVAKITGLSLEELTNL